MTAIALKITAAPIARPAIAVRRPSLCRVLAYHWDLFTTVSLTGSSAAYAGCTLSHLS